MDSLTAAAARALAKGDPLGALKRVALRADAPALALRGIALAQLGDLGRARVLLRSAARAFGVREKVARARCIVAEAEIALVSRDLRWSAKALDGARVTLDAHGDLLNAAFARHLEVRRLVLIGHLDEAERALERLDASRLPRPARAAHELVVAAIALRRIRTAAAREALARAELIARQAGIPTLSAEVGEMRRLLTAPAARLTDGRTSRLLRLDEVEALLASDACIVDACRHLVRNGNIVVSLITRPVLFALARALGEAWPSDVRRDVLIATVFESRFPDESYRARLRVEVGRLRKALRRVADVHATPRGFTIAPRQARRVVLLAPPTDGDHGSVLALLADGESWSSSALALALGRSQRTVQRALDALRAAGQVHAFGSGRARRWGTPPASAFASTLLLPAPFPGD